VNRPFREDLTGTHVLDKSCFRMPELEGFLSRSPANRVVVVGFALMECFTGGNPIKNATKSLSILSRHPNQVLVLHNARELLRAAPDGDFSPLALVDPRATEDFRLTFALVTAAAAGHPAAVKEVQAMGKSATDKQTEILELANLFVDCFGDGAHMAEEVEAYRRNIPFSDESRFRSWIQSVDATD